jgi:hypothetical protein
MNRHCFRVRSTTRQHHAPPALRAKCVPATGALFSRCAARLRGVLAGLLRHYKSNFSSAFHAGDGHPDVQLTGHSTRLSGGVRVWDGLIVVKLNGGGRGVTCRAIKPVGKL